VKALFAAHGNGIAAVIVEPVAGNMGVVPPSEGFLQSLREITLKYGALLIFDEVMTGFRVSSGGAQTLYDVKPDITTLGKIVGGGMPIGAYGGAREIMSQIAPLGPVYQAGTLSGNPVAVASGLVTLKILKNNPDIYDKLERITRQLANSIVKDCNELEIPCICNRVGSMMTLFFTERESVLSYQDAKESDTRRFGQFFNAMLDAGVYLPPSQFEAWFVSAAHSEADMDIAMKQIRKALELVKGQK
jgi:glutamate-1-semialdehyde 2,1-aminomutase